MTGPRIDRAEIIRSQYDEHGRSRYSVVAINADGERTEINHLLLSELLGRIESLFLQPHKRDIRRTTQTGD